MVDYINGGFTLHGLVEQTEEWKKQYGPVYGLYFGREPSLVINDLDILKEVLVKDFQHFTDRRVSVARAYVEKGVFFQGGADWKRIRNIITPTFSSGKLKLMIGNINKCGGLLSDNLVTKAKKGETVDVKRYFGAYTMDVIATTAFGLDIDSQTNPDEPLVHNARKLFAETRLASTAMLISMVFPFLKPLLKLLDVGFFPAGPVNFFVRSIKAMIEQRKTEDEATRSQRTDFLQLLLKAESEEINDEKVSNGTQTKAIKRLTLEEIIGQAFLFFIAGYETTANTLHFVAYNLAKNPEVQEKVIKEIEAHVGDREPTYDDINKLTYMEQVIMETLRINPPVVMVNRKSSEDVSFKGIHIPRDTTVMIPIYSVQHDPLNYENPEEFRPERFDPATRKESNPVTFLSFGYGPRLCIGMRLAMVETKIALVYALRKIRFVKCSETPEKLEYNNVGLLSPKVPIIVAVDLVNQS
ncbi:cytochrome P450 3A24 isoform X2 [Patella vulgata]|uniref:cytochrome P450 3A24 isoform X2 n=1 Tax=Patella vulgata TaxID=6465 RepID=UPI0024A9EFBE|nr:cytochrome P450 3A24 isoform X2 [Patella vulgata]